MSTTSTFLKVRLVDPVGSSKYATSTSGQGPNYQKCQQVIFETYAKNTKNIQKRLCETYKRIRRQTGKRWTVIHLIAKISVLMTSQKCYEMAQLLSPKVEQKKKESIASIKKRVKCPETMKRFPGQRKKDVPKDLKVWIATPNANQ